jgi:hypothetical protein
VSIIDLGLFIDEALELKLQTEEFTRRKALPSELDLSDSERKHFEGRRVGEKSWICERVELNAFSAPALINYIEEKLKKAGAYGKVIPSRADLVANARIEFQDQLGRQVDHDVSEILSLEDMKKEIFEILAPDFLLSGGWVKEAFAEDPSISWRTAVQIKCSEILSSRGQEIVSLLGTMLRVRH